MNARGTQGRTSLLDLPQEALHIVHAQLESVDALRLGCTCKGLASILQAEDLWQRACHERWYTVTPFVSSSTSDTWNWKTLFFRRNGWAGTALKRAVVQRFAFFHRMELEWSQSQGALSHRALTYDALVS